MSRDKYWNLCIGARNTANLCWIWAQKLTWTNWRNSWIGARSTANQWQIWARNVTRDNFVYWRSNFSLSMLNMNAKRDSCRTKEFVNCLSKYSLSMRKMGSKNTLRQLKKFLICLSTCNTFVLDMGSKFATTKKKNAYSRSVYNPSVPNVVVKQDSRQKKKEINS
jgi:hypothetical protein